MKNKKPIGIYLISGFNLLIISTFSLLLLYSFIAGGASIFIVIWVGGFFLIPLSVLGFFSYKLLRQSNAARAITIVLHTLILMVLIILTMVAYSRMLGAERYNDILYVEEMKQRIMTTGPFIPYFLLSIIYLFLPSTSKYFSQKTVKSSKL